jgi:esterase/lipase superfamily enzyme
MGCFGMSIGRPFDELIIASPDLDVGVFQRQV